MRIYFHEEMQVPTVANGDQCVLYGQCVAICPQDAIARSALEARRCRPVSEMPKVDAEVVTAVLRQRRSMRNYKQQLIPRAELEELAEIGGFSSTSAHGGEGRTRRCIIVSGEENLHRVRDMTTDYLDKLAKLLGSPVIRTVARFKHAARFGHTLQPDITVRLRRYRQGEDVITYGAPHAIFFHSSEHSVYP